MCDICPETNLLDSEMALSNNDAIRPCRCRSSETPAPKIGRHVPFVRERLLNSHPNNGGSTSREQVMTLRLNRLLPVALAVVCLLGVRSVATTAPSLPSQIADETFWRLVTDLSEPDGHFLSDNFASNESA